MIPFVVGTIAKFDEIVRSSAFSVDCSGSAEPAGHRVRYANALCGTTVAFMTYACPAAGTLHGLPTTFTFVDPENGWEPVGFLVSNTRQAVSEYNDNPKVAGGAK